MGIAGRVRNWMVYEDELFTFHKVKYFEVSTTGKRYHERKRDDLDVDSVAGLLARLCTAIVQRSAKEMTSLPGPCEKP
ncbi:hypothetical protein JTB14_004294 [Gonioctena quinquepunctata]|nr:hypothetical protein JTB14_004294 [Gonioctena quinquepunctata]